jgi:hypothetical protein
MVPKFFYAKLIIYITFHDKPTEVPIEVTGYKFGCGWGAYAPNDTKIKPRICENADSKSAHNDKNL